MVSGERVQKHYYDGIPIHNVRAGILFETGDWSGTGKGAPPLFVPDEGFGPRKKDLVQTIDSEEMIKKINPKPGMILSLNIDKDGTEQKIPATIMEVSGSKITVDYNHPLSGHHLTYDLTLVDIIKPESKE
jgi:hypothetical protein